MGNGLKIEQTESGKYYVSFAGMRLSSFFIKKEDAEKEYKIYEERIKNL